MTHIHITPQAMKAAIIVCITFFLFNVSDVFRKELMDTQTAIQIAFCTSILGTIAISTYVFWRYGKGGFSPNGALKLMIVRGVLSMLVTVCANLGMSLIPFADFYGIVFLIPLCTSLMAFFILHEDVKAHHIVAIAAGFLGVLIIAKPGFQTFNMGVLYTILLVIFMAAQTIITRKIKNTVQSETITFYTYTTVFLCSLPFMALYWRPIETTYDFTLLFVLSPLLMVVGQQMLIYSITIAPSASFIAPFQYTQIIWGIIFGFFIFSEVPDVTTLAGAGIIIAAGFYLIRQERRLKKAAKG